MPDLIDCAECSFDNPEGANYCAKCGAALWEDENELDDPAVLDERIRELEAMLVMETQRARQREREHGGNMIEDGELWALAWSMIFDLVHSEDEDDRAKGIDLMQRRLREEHRSHVRDVANKLGTLADAVDRQVYAIGAALEDDETTTPELRFLVLLAIELRVVATDARDYDPAAGSHVRRPHFNETREDACT